MSDVLIRDDVKIEWVELGEGLSGDYDEDDPEDEELLRFDIYVKGTIAQRWLDEGAGYNLMYGEEEIDPNEFYAMTDGSYCTGFPADSTPEQRLAGLNIIMNKVYDDVLNGYDRSAQEASWINLTWLEK